MPAVVTAGQKNKLVEYIQWINHTESGGENLGSYYDADFPTFLQMTEPTLASQRFVNFTTGSDANDGTQGSPWKTFVHAAEQLAISSTWYCLNLSDNITIDNGGGDPGVLNTISKYWAGTGPGNISQFAIIRKDPAAADITIAINDPLELEKLNYVLWWLDGVTMVGPRGIRVGTDTAQHHHTIRKATITPTDGSGLNGGAGLDNYAPGVYSDINGNLNSYGAFDNTLDGSALSQVSALNGNSAGFITFGMTQCRIENNVLINFPRPIYLKHGNDPAGAAADIHVRNNYVRVTPGYFTSTDGDCYFAASKAGGQAEITNNIFDCPVSINNGGGGPQINDVDFFHNTVTGAFRLELENDPVLNATILNNILQGKVYVLDKSGGDPTVTVNTNFFNYNVFGGGFRYQAVDYTVAEFTALNEPSGQNANSLVGLPTYTGGATPTTIAGFALSGGLGVAAASDGSNMGADVSIVGVAA